MLSFSFFFDPLQQYLPTRLSKAVKCTFPLVKAVHCEQCRFYSIGYQRSVVHPRNTITGQKGRKTGQKFSVFLACASCALC